VQVRDNGVGIAMGDRERIFEAHQRARSESVVALSMGLGLSISRSLASLMGGKLTYRYERGESVFELVLPSLPPIEPAA
jgi:two-component system sensor histidine kinase KdpD